MAKEQSRETTQTNGKDLSSNAQDSVREGWRRVIERAGVPPSFRDAHVYDLRQIREDDAKRAAVDVMRQYAEDGYIERNGYRQWCILLSGSFGTGKTHAATAVFLDRLWRSRRKQGMWRKYTEFVREVQATYSRAAERSVQQVLASYQKTPLLLLDDVGDLTIDQETEDRRRLVYEVIDYRNDWMLPTILTTNLSASALQEQFGERTWERLSFMATLLRLEGANLRRNRIKPTDYTNDEEPRR